MRNCLTNGKREAAIHRIRTETTWIIGLGVILAEISWERFESFQRRHSGSREEKR